ncbi:putative F-box protein At3g24700 [Chenopodium quinoa]|uniref:F-box domain-containing protein n=1 Tax=Chenopodium quinoa TaxID=63459 RepID=A0A803N379_CHEQI|nr:putative F-box protein At3g24700 [Chenopodium quinoa]
MANKLPDLSMDLWKDILARLPAKTLMRFRCVCKTWCSIIDSSDFIFLHHQIYDNNKHKYVIARKLGEYSIYSIDTFMKIDVFSKTPDRCVVVGSCNGLVLMYSLAYKNIQMMIYNPCIRKSVVIPPCPFRSMGYRIDHWLGFAPSSKDYKLLAYGCASLKSPEFSIAVYSLNDRVWRIKDRSDAHVRGLSFKDEDTFYVKGGVYWFGYDPDKPRGLHTHLGWFDFDSEEFNLVDLPDALKQTGLVIKTSFVLGESIAVFGMSSDCTFIWVLIEDGGNKSWQLWYNGDSNVKALGFLTRSICTGIFDVEKNTFFVFDNERLYSYNYKSHHIQLVENYNDGRKFFFTFKESLVLHTKNKGMDKTAEYQRRSVKFC